MPKSSPRWRWLLAAVIAGLAGFSYADEVASFPSLDGTRLVAHVFQPKDPPKGVVIALHGCGGLLSIAPAKRGKLTLRHQAMADMLTAEGYAAVFPDSFTPRGITGVCKDGQTSLRLMQTERPADVLGAMAWVAAQPWAPPGRIALLGWSHGGGTVLAAINAERPDVSSQSLRPIAAITFYPACRPSMRSAYRPDTRLVMLLAEKDDWTAPGPCIELARRAGAELQVYPDSYHGFDNPQGEVRLWREITTGVHPTAGVHVGANPVAREQANRRVREVLEEAFR